MKKLLKILFATALVTGATFVPTKAYSETICEYCDRTGDCQACCVCGGTGPALCARLCS
jgi:molybdopterin biosynthesis enzyme MoaB